MSKQINLAGKRLLRLQELETVIRDGIAQFIAVGQALLEIRDSKLYCDQFETWEEYCRVRWNFTDRRALQLMGAAQVMETLRRHISYEWLPKNESQVRPLVGLPERDQVEYWNMALILGRTSGEDLDRLVRVMQSRFAVLKENVITAKLTPKQALGAAKVLVSIDDLGAADLMDNYEIHNPDVLEEMDRLRRSGSETYEDIMASGYLQDTGDDEPIPAGDMTMLQLRRVLKRKADEHRQRAILESQARRRVGNYLAKINNKSSNG